MTSTSGLPSEDRERTLVSATIDAFLAEQDLATMDHVARRGAQFDAGLAWVHFAEGDGGLGVRPSLQSLVDDRLSSAGIEGPSEAGFFLALAGPTIATHGTVEQRRRYLRPMFTEQERWCQLFSEPGAGSDFAGLGCRAVRDGDEWVVNGQKVWNTLAHIGDWGMLVTRTHPELPKHKGMTYFLLDMHAPGVEVRPLRQITGEAEFNEVYLADVRIPDACRLGEPGDGWRVALTTLMNERTAIGGGARPGPGSGPIADAVALWQEIPADRRRPADRDRLVGLWNRSEVLRLTNLRAAAAATVANPGPEGSIGKLMSAELHQAVYTFCVELLGASAMVGFDYTFRRPQTLSTDGAIHGPRHAFLRTRANSIEGGTSEIMRNILGEQVLGLPGEPRVDKDLAWSDIPRS